MNYQCLLRAIRAPKIQKVVHWTFFFQWIHFPHSLVIASAFTVHFTWRKKIKAKHLWIVLRYNFFFHVSWKKAITKNPQPGVSFCNSYVIVQSCITLKKSSRFLQVKFLNISERRKRFLSKSSSCQEQSSGLLQSISSQNSKTRDRFLLWNPLADEQLLTHLFYPHPICFSKQLSPELLYSSANSKMERCENQK